MGGLASLPGLEAVREQLAGVIAVIRAELARRDAGVAVTRPAWKNLVFTGGPGCGKSRAAAAVGRIYRGLGVLSSGQLTEVASADLAGTSKQETGRLIREAVSRARGGILLITDAHAYARLQAGDQQVLRGLQEVLSDFRDDLVVILAGRAGPLRRMLRASPALASRFPVIIDFPGYTAGQLAAIFATLVGEAGFTLTPAAARKADTVLGRALRDLAGGSARLAVRLLDQATASQARRITTAGQPLAPAALHTIDAPDIPDHLDLHVGPELVQADDEWPGQYL
jgi:hypothetical protein